jgi:uncharacterized membrane protein
MFKRWQGIVIGLWVVLPLVLLVALFVINPGYMSNLFTFIGPIAGMSLFIFLEVVNLVVLLVGFRALNAWQRRRAEDKQRLPRAAAVALAVVTLLACTLPTLWVVLLYPSVIVLMRTEGTF